MNLNINKKNNKWITICYFFKGILLYNKHFNKKNIFSQYKEGI